MQDPYGCALTTNPQGQQIVSVYRRPLPTTNLGFLSAVMFDGRESLLYPLNSEPTFAANLNTDLTQQATDATLIHAQATQPPTATQLSQIVGFESLSTLPNFRTSSREVCQKGQTAERNPCLHNPTIRESTIPSEAILREKQFTPNVFTIYTSFQELAESAAGFDCPRRADLQHATPHDQRCPGVNDWHSADYWEPAPLATIRQCGKSLAYPCRSTSEPVTRSLTRPTRTSLPRFSNCSADFACI